MTREDIHRTDSSDIASGETLPPITPGDILSHEFMRPLGLSARALARDLGCPANRITGIVNGTRAITAATALALAKRFATSAEFWMHMQVAHDLELARRAA